MARRFALSIDLDPLSCYRDIYSLGPGPKSETESDPVYTKAIPRFSQLCESLGIKGTLFIVGKSFDQPNAVQSASQAADAGHELANHSHNHHYDLSKTAEEEQITRCSDTIEKVCGIRPVGFRAPGYLLGPNLLPLLPVQGIQYDSSVLPSPAYQGLKAGVLTLMRLLGRPSASILGDPREALAPNTPYRPNPNRPWRRGESPLLELPISAPLGLPLTGGLLALGGRTLSKLLALRLASAEWVQLELHGVDLLDIASDGLDPALAPERSLRIDWRKKMGLYREFIEKVIEGREVQRLCDVNL